MRRIPALLLFAVLFLLTLTLSPKANAATLSQTSATLSTSRPSASAPITAARTATATQVTVVDLNDNLIFLASDSAQLRPDTGESLTTVTIATASAADTPASGQRIVYFANDPDNNTHHAGDPLVVPITAMHTIQFTVPNAVPSSGKIVLTYPLLSTGDANNAASPSASTFQMNGLADAQIEVWDDAGEISPTVAVSNPSAGTSPIITLTLAANIDAGSLVKIYLGCSVSTASLCSTPASLIINPTQGSTANGTARIWQLIVETKDTNDVVIDSAKVKIGTIDSVLVQATVDPVLTVTIAGINDAINFNATSGCASETTNSGINSSATSVNLGILSNGIISKAGQTITVTTNSQFGYSITATSSGRLKDPASGLFIIDVNDNGSDGDGLDGNDSPAPSAFGASGTPGFGIFPCGQRVPTSSPDYDDESALAFSGGGKGTNPWNTGLDAYYATIATYSGPGGISSDATAIRYAATVSSTTPPGLYRTMFTYVVTPTF